jgi:Histidine kinase-, DNA gyrase B-, and HSP90-like ATPase
VGETRVDLLHLLEDLRDAYPGATEETILTEIVANALDSGAATIAIATDSTEPALTIVDDGEGMRRRELARYHDIAASTKVKGERIGFAGVGIKIGLLVSTEVLTETRHGRHHVATTWGLASRHRAPWRWVSPPGLVAERGTAVRLKLGSALSPLLDAGFIEGALRRHFQPLFDPALTDMLAAHYPRGVRVVLNGRRLDKEGWDATETAGVAIRLARKRKPSAAGYLIRDRFPLPEERRGLAISTFGKIIKRGWDWLGLTPVAFEHLGGLIEVPALAECLTLNKADFIRAGARGALYLAYRKAIQEAVSRQLSLWGDAHEADARARRRAARPVERDLERVLTDLVEDFPLLSTLVEQRAGGQRKLPIGSRRVGSDDGQPAGPLFATPEEAEQANGNAEKGDPAHPGEAESPSEQSYPAESRPPAAVAELPPPATADLPATPRERRPARYGLSIQFEQRPEDPELGRLVESTVWVNEAHPAYRRAAASRSEGYHVALAAAMALAAVAVEPAKEHAFVTAFLASWGAALDRRKRGRRR